MKNRALPLLVGIILIASSMAALSLTCPLPSSISYVNGQWVAPEGWKFNQIPEVDPKDVVGSLVQVDWLAIIKGDSQGSVDWCQYTWKKDKGADPVSLSWWGNPMFVKRKHLSAWTPVGDGKSYRCKAGAQTCSFTSARF